MRRRSDRAGEVRDDADRVRFADAGHLHHLGDAADVGQRAPDKVQVVVLDQPVEVGAVTDSPARRNAHAAALRQQAAEQIILNDPFVQQMQRDFGAKIVPGSIKPIAKQ